MSTGDQESVERPRSFGASEILECALDGMEGLPSTLAAELLAEICRDDGNRVQRIQDTIRSAANG